MGGGCGSREEKRGKEERFTGREGRGRLSDWHWED